MKELIPISLFVLFAVLAIVAFYEGGSSIVYTTVTAVISLGFALFNFYFHYFRDVHKLRFPLVDISFNGQSMDAYCTFENTGTNEEIIIGGTFVFPKESTSEYSTITRKPGIDNLPEIMEPFILRPNQVELRHFNWPVSYDDLLFHFDLERDQKFEQVVNLKVDFINPTNRSKAAKLIGVGTIRFDEEFASFSHMHRRQTQLFEGKLQPI